MHKIAHLKKNLSSFDVICVTGQMAAGKNYICSQLEKDEWNSVDADKLVHQAIKDAADEIFTTFKSDAEKLNVNLKNEDGSINRRALGQIVFSNPKLLAKQENIVYPRITKMINDFISQNSKTIINATVLFKTPDLLKLCQTVVFVKASFIKRIIRAKKRDQLPLRQILNRLAAQKNLLESYKEKTSNIIIFYN